MAATMDDLSGEDADGQQYPFRYNGLQRMPPEKRDAPAHPDPLIAFVIRF